MSLLTEENIEKNPMDQFGLWFIDVQQAKFKEPTTMVLATCSRDGKPSARNVLMKDFGKDGFTFFTNYLSRKGRELEENPKAALVFYWDILDRQVRVEGLVEKVSDDVSDVYFETRPLESKIGACVSPQSQIIEGREVLEKKYEELSQKYGGQKIPRPPHWGGYILKPNYFEFWQARPGRLHDRIAYVHTNKLWKVYRLAP